jgi:Ca2+-binding RTX toxin-like protein
MQRGGEGAVVRQGRSIAVVVAFLIGCAVFLLAGASGVQAEASNKEEARCEGTRKINVNLPARFTTNDLPGCPQGGLLLGTDKPDRLAGEKGDDEVRGLGGKDEVWGGSGNDVLYGGSERDSVIGDLLNGDDGDDVIYGGPGDDKLDGGPSEAVYGEPGELLPGGGDGQRDKIYCGEGRDSYFADKEDYVSSSCEVKLPNSLRFPNEEATVQVAAGGGGRPVAAPSRFRRLVDLPSSCLLPRCFSGRAS